MAKHTPGPWTVDGPPDNQIVWSSAENRVCFLAHSNGLDDERDIATGHLIAAAPDLYQELDGIVHFADGFVVYYNDGPLGKALRSWIEGARTALAKARGEDTPTDAR